MLTFQNLKLSHLVCLGEKLSLSLDNLQLIKAHAITRIAVDHSRTPNKIPDSGKNTMDLKTQSSEITC